MEWLNNFFAPLIQVIFIFGISIAFIFILARALYKKWTTEWEFDYKYNVQKKEVDPMDIEWLKSLPEDQDIQSVLMNMLVTGIEKHKINELLYLYKQTKGGQTNDRKQTKISNRSAKKRRFFFFKARS